MSLGAAGSRDSAAGARDGRLPWPFLGIFTVAEAAALLVADARGGEPAQIVMLFVGTVALLLAQKALGKESFVPLPQLSRQRPAELKRAWLFQALLLPLYLLGIALLLVIRALDVGGGFWFWFYLALLLSPLALWNSNRFRSAYARFATGERQRGGHRPATGDRY